MLILKTAKRQLKKLINMYFPSIPRFRQDWNKWQEGSRMEFVSQQKSEYRQSDRFEEDSKWWLFEFFGLPQDKFHGRVIIDFGAGSRLRTRYFEDARIVAIEPLAERFMGEMPWCDLQSAYKVYSTPAEQRIDECVGIADLIVSINVLDHCYDFEKIIENVSAYLKPDGMACLSFDEHTITDRLHPLRLNHEMCTKVFESNGLIVDKYSRVFGLNGGDCCYTLNYWLVKAKR
jgi:SAM-dependent methyltransferase